MHTLNPLATISQRETLATAISRTANIKNDFNDFDNEIHTALIGITGKQCSYLNMLVFNNKIFKLKQFLTDRGMTIIN